MLLPLIVASVGCDRGSVPVSRPKTDPDPTTTKIVAPRVIVDACQKAAAITDVPVLCPTFVPRPARQVRIAFPHLYKLRAGVANTASKRWYDIYVLYGQPSGEGRQTYGPARFLHFEVAAGPLVNYMIGADGSPASVRIGGRIAMGGHQGYLYYQRPHPTGGEWGDHYFFVWNQNHTRYYASIHSWVNKTVVLQLLSKLIYGLVPSDRVTNS